MKKLKLKLENAKMKGMKWDNLIRMINNMNKCIQIYKSLCPNGEIDERARQMFKDNLLKLSRYAAIFAMNDEP